MELPPELTRIPMNSLDVLRYMGQHNVEAADADMLAEGTGMSERGIGKAIRGLVTKGYLNMDSNYVYYLTDKGQQAILDLAEYDAEQAASGGEEQPEKVVEASVIAVVSGSLKTGQPNQIQVGVNGSAHVREETQLVIRLNVVGGSATPPEVTLLLTPGQAPAPANITLQPGGDSMRVRIEGVQLIGMADVHPAGGMFFDLNVSDQDTPKAWHGRLALK
jgi:hypothetical protein